VYLLLMANIISVISSIVFHIFCEGEKQQSFGCGCYCVFLSFML
jgi:hypothetical protein